jgi:hypothetical protein
MKKMFEFLCDDAHLSEKLVDGALRVIDCPQCGKEAHRIVSTPNIKLEGVTGAFPGAYDRWERVRAEKLSQERKQAAKNA